MARASTAKKRVRRNMDPESPEFRAIHWYAKGSPQKARRVMDKVRGLPVSDALDQLRHMSQRAAFQVDKLLKSAIANADKAIEEELIRDPDGDVIEPQPDVDVDDLYIHELKADDGPRLKRWRPRARGSAYPFRKYYSHLSIKLRPLPGKGK